MNTVICPNCKQSVEISEALSHQLREKVLIEVNEKHKAEIEKITLQIEQEATKRVKEELEMKFKNSQMEAAEVKERNKSLQQQMLQLTKDLRDMKQKDSEREIEMQKRLLKDREMMETEIARSEQEKARLDKMELQKQLDDTKKVLEEAQRKAQQSSQQLQGEVLELDLQAQLTECFTTDEIKPVPKGVDGADIIQTVKNKYGSIAGSIVWETKRTKAWNNAWLSKLREDVRTLGANCSILVSDILPPDIETFGLVDQVWVTSYRYAIPLAQVLRNGILHVAIAKSTSANKDEKLESLYQYLTNASFKHRFEAQVEAIIELRTDFESEQRTMTRLWKKKEMQLNRMTKNVASLYGELQGILGSALPAIQGLEMDEIDSSFLHNRVIPATAGIQTQLRKNQISDPHIANGSDGARHVGNDEKLYNKSDSSDEKNESTQSFF